MRGGDPGRAGGVDLEHPRRGPEPRRRPFVARCRFAGLLGHDRPDGELRGRRGLAPARGGRPLATRAGLDRPGRPRPRRVLARHPSPALARRTVGPNPRILAIVSRFPHAGGSNPAHEAEEARSCDSPGSGSRSSA